MEKVFLEISQNSQENTCARVSFLIKLQASCEFCEISKNTIFYRTTPVAASVRIAKRNCGKNFKLFNLTNKKLSQLIYQILFAK